MYQWVSLAYACSRTEICLARKIKALLPFFDYIPTTIDTHLQAQPSEQHGKNIMPLYQHLHISRFFVLCSFVSYIVDTKLQLYYICSLLQPALPSHISLSPLGFTVVLHLHDLTARSLQHIIIKYTCMTADPCASCSWVCIAHAKLLFSQSCEYMQQSFTWNDACSLFYST